MRASSLLLVLASCGLGARDGGGSDNIPTAGLGPYGKIQAPDTPTTAQEPFVVIENAARLRDPSALSLPGGGFRIFYTRESDEEIAIYRSDIIADLHSAPTEAPVPSLRADQSWEEGTVSAPAALRDPRAGSHGLLLLYYQAGGQIGLAVSFDDGRMDWSKVGPVLADAEEPAAVLVEDRVLLYFTRPGADGIFVAESSDGGDSFTALDEPVLRRRDTDEGAFDRFWVGQPGAAGGVTEAGVPHVALFFAGRNTDGVIGLGAAASRDGLVFERAFAGRAILSPDAPDETGPSPVLFPDEGVLFFTQPFVQVTAIAAATSP